MAVDLELANLRTRVILDFGNLSQQLQSAKTQIQQLSNDASQIGNKIAPGATQAANGVSKLAHEVKTTNDAIRQMGAGDAMRQMQTVNEGFMKISSSIGSLNTAFRALSTGGIGGIAQALTAVLGQFGSLNLQMEKLKNFKGPSGGTARTVEQGANYGLEALMGADILTNVLGHGKQLKSAGARVLGALKNVGAAAVRAPIGAGGLGAADPSQFPQGIFRNTVAQAIMGSNYGAVDPLSGMITELAEDNINRTAWAGRNMRFWHKNRSIGAAGRWMGRAGMAGARAMGLAGGMGGTGFMSTAIGGAAVAAAPLAIAAGGLAYAYSNAQENNALRDSNEAASNDFASFMAANRRGSADTRFQLENLDLFNRDATAAQKDLVRKGLENKLSGSAMEVLKRTQQDNESQKVMRDTWYGKSVVDEEATKARDIALKSRIDKQQKLMDQQDEEYRKQQKIVEQEKATAEQVEKQRKSRESVLEIIGRIGNINANILQNQGKTFEAQQQGNFNEENSYKNDWSRRMEAAKKAGDQNQINVLNQEYQAKSLEFQSRNERQQRERDEATKKYLSTSSFDTQSAAIDKEAREATAANPAKTAEIEQTRLQKQLDLTKKMDAQFMGNRKEQAIAEQRLNLDNWYKEIEGYATKNGKKLQLDEEYARRKKQIDASEELNKFDEKYKDYMKNAPRFASAAGTVSQGMLSAIPGNEKWKRELAASQFVRDMNFQLGDLAGQLSPAELSKAQYGISLLGKEMMQGPSRQGTMTGMSSYWSSLQSSVMQPSSNIPQATLDVIKMLDDKAAQTNEHLKQIARQRENIATVAEGN